MKCWVMGKWIDRISETSNYWLSTFAGFIPAISVSRTSSATESTFVIAGLLNKQIAYELGISEETVKIHRGRMMKKMKVESVAELVRVTQIAGIEPAEAGDQWRVTSEKWEGIGPVGIRNSELKRAKSKGYRA